MRHALLDSTLQSVDAGDTCISQCNALEKKKDRLFPKAGMWRSLQEGKLAMQTRLLVMHFAFLGPF